MSEDTHDRSMDDVSLDGSHDVEPLSHGNGTWKVLGETDASDGTGVLGHATSGSGRTTGVTGISDSTDAAATGVLGKAMGFTTAATYGVQGVTSSAETSGSGVFGHAPVPTGSSANGVGGRSDGEADGATGVLGEATAAVQSTTFGVDGKTAGEGTGASGVRGQAITATSTETYGVRGSSASTGGYGVYSEGNSKTAGDHEVTGTLVGSGIVGTTNIATDAVTNAKIDFLTTIDRSKLDLDRITIQIDSSQTGSYPTSGEETVFVDPSSQTVTITLSNNDGVDGRKIRVVDQTGAAGSNPIFIEPGVNLSLEGPNSSTINTARGYRTYQFFDGVWHEVNSN